MKRIYWDTAAGTALDKRVLKAMMPYLGGSSASAKASADKWGNPASIHREGVEASRAVEEARAKIAEILFAHPDEIIFTGSGTESDNLAILGTAEMRSPRDVRRTTSGTLEVALLTSGKTSVADDVRSETSHIITTQIEHKAVLEPCRYLQRKGYKVTYLKVDKDGIVDLKELKELLTEKTFLVSIMLANNEIGAIQPIKEVAKIIRHFKKENGLDKITNQASKPYLHIDACQAPRFLDLNVEKLGVDLMSFNGSKIYGPKGVGTLYVRRGVMLAPMIMGGGQERGLRSGTLNVAGIVGLAKALEICQAEREAEVKKLVKAQSKLMMELEKIPDLMINGPVLQTGEAVRRTTSGSLEVALLTASPLTFPRLPNNVNFSIENFEGEQLVIELDAKGFAVSSGSACSSADSANDNVRISFGREVTTAEVNSFVRALKAIINKYQEIGKVSLALKS